MTKHKLEDVNTLAVSAISDGKKYRFEFYQNGGKSGLITTAHRIFSAYNSSRSYREVKLRASLFYNQDLRLLPKEMIQETICGASSFNHDSGILGDIILTNKRFIWVSHVSLSFNIAIPYCRIKNIHIKSSSTGDKFFVCPLVMSCGKIEMKKHTFMIQPTSRCVKLFETLREYIDIATKSPDYGVRMKKDTQPEPIFTHTLEDTIESEDKDSELFHDTKLLKYVDHFDEQQNKSHDAEEGISDIQKPKISYSSYLGIAIEQTDVDITKIWAL
ncbi:Bardet-Biedl syndrome 5 protein like protein [Aduncisulcus paluster]|uniref:Bardet-Biedl syndrome 5 protein like protein n=1 Tax=Aduncisulcus paluster TaxID=2918883 RepID=A0ABQ5KQK9_9EUKA|nr:Bardet-Biedl syndrome 5 protein like protein [Aduncisulcus paluster]